MHMKKIPKIKLQLTNEDKFDSSNIKNNVVLFFYPKALTGGCSLEVDDFQKYLSKFYKIGFEVIGASKDSVDKNKKFSDKYKLKYPLGSDEGKNCEKLGIWIEKFMYGRKYFGIDRSTFVIDNKGRILRKWNKVKVKGHVEEVFNFCKNI
tara:strand:- start:274 stop:723 length:450 start_codon:yes stop_codon:yes gene_type:complete